MKAVYRLNVDYGRMGNITGVFVEKKSLVDMLINYGVGVYFGEILGKHSEVIVMIEENMIEIITIVVNICLLILFAIYIVKANVTVGLERISYLLLCILAVLLIGL